MFTITNKTNGSKVIWDAEKDAPLLVFDKGGVFITSDASVAKKAEAIGCTVVSDKAAEEKPVTKKKATQKAEKAE